MAEQGDLTPTPGALGVLAGWVEPLSRRDLDFGHWVPSDRLPGGSMTLPWVELGLDGMRFLREVSGAGFVVPFDWMTWAATGDGAAYRQDRTRIADASAEDLVRLLTTIVRGDRFREGELLYAFESGLLLAIAQRARELTAHLGA